MPMTSSDTVSSTVLIQNQHLRRREPTERDELVLHAEVEARRLEETEEICMRLSPRLHTNKLLHTMFSREVSDWSKRLE